MNSVAWAPHEYGLLLACGSSDGNVSFVRLCDNGRWQAEVVPVEEGGNHCGVTSVSWAPAGPAMRLAVGCCDGTVRVFSAAAAAAAAKWSQTVAGRHGDWVRCVAWAPCAAECGGNAVIASCAQDCEVAVWKAAKDSAAAAAAAWEKVLVGPGKFPDGAWTVAWSECGTTLAVTAADGKVSLWKESFDSDAWDCIDTFDDDDDDATNAEN